jgi:hypothetical protein
MKQFVQDHLMEDPAQLLLAYSGKVDFDLKFAVQQIKARQKAKSKIPSWYMNEKLIFPVSLSMEQASSEETALFKAEMFSGEKMIDLTGGLGVDSFFVGLKFDRAIYCEQNAELFEISKHNLEFLSPSKFEFYNGDSIDLLSDFKEKVDLIFVDPARRGEGNKKLFKLEDCEPDVIQHWEIFKSKAKSILVKASPMLDIKSALSSLPGISKVMVLSVKNEVKEILLFWSEAGKEKDELIEAVDITREAKSTFSFSYFEEENAVIEISDSVGHYLIEPNAVILKAGAYQTFGIRFGLKKIHPNSHFYTSDVIIEDCPGRVFEVIAEIQQPKKEVKKLFPNGIVNVITRNYSMPAEALKKKFRLKDGGEDFLIGSKTEKGYKLWLCRLV